jgi:hypothetical protein
MSVSRPTYRARVRMRRINFVNSTLRFPNRNTRAEVVENRERSLVLPRGYLDKFTQQNNQRVLPPSLFSSRSSELLTVPRSAGARGGYMK